MKKILPFLLSFISIYTFSQDTIRYSSSRDTIRFSSRQQRNSENIREISIDSIILLKGKDIKKPKRITPQRTPTLVQVNDSLVDYISAAKIDKLWLESMIDSPLNKSNSYILGDNEIYRARRYRLDTRVLKERLKELDEKTPFHIEYNPHLEYMIKSYLKSRKSTFSTLMERARYFFPLFESVLAKYNIPLEIKYLAIVESALRPTAESPAGARGLWQFMYQTGKQFDLKISSYVDERSDPYKSTEAACKYLSKLYEIFNDWDLALAAYNSGPGNVSKAIRRSGGRTNYWNIRPYLPRETAEYLPAFYATLYIFEYAEEHHIKGRRSALPYFQTDSIEIKRQLTFGQIHNMLGIDIRILQFLNPQYKLDIIPYVRGRNYKLVLPIKYIGPFVSNEHRIYNYAKRQDAKREKPLPKYVERSARIRYTVKRGDYLGKIARRFGVSVKQIKKWNNIKGFRISEGKRLIIYPKK